MLTGKDLFDSHAPSQPDMQRLEAPAPYPNGDDANELDYAVYSRAMWDDQEEALYPLHQVWMQNLLFLAGRQWWRPNTLSGIWGPTDVPEWREQPVSNLTLAFFKTFLSKVTKVRPAWMVRPASGDAEDVKASELAQEVLEAKWIDLRLSRMLRLAATWTIVTGNSFLLPFWNTVTGKLKPLTVEIDQPVIDPATGQVKLDLNGEPITEPIECNCDEEGEPLLLSDGTPDLEADPYYIDEGEVGVRVYSPFQVRVNPDAEVDEDVRWVIISEVMTTKDIVEEWPEAWDKVVAEDIGYMEQYDRLVTSIAGGADTQLTAFAGKTDSQKAKALVLHYYERPTSAYPNGRYWCTAGKTALLVPPTDLPDGWPSVVHMVDIQVPGRFYGMATMEAIVGLNREYNELNAQVKEHHNLLSKGKWLVPKGSGIKKGAITTQPGEVVQYNVGFKPEQADLKPLPAAVYGERERVMSDWEAVGGVHKVSMGQAPPGVTAGVAFLQLQEADDTDLGPFLAMLEESIAQLAGRVLEIIKENYTDERLIYVSGPNRRYQVKAFQGADLEGAVDVVPVAESSFPWSKTARQNMLIQLASQIPSLFQDKETGQFDTETFTRLLPIGGLEAVTGQEDLDIQEALREEEMFEMFGVEDSQLPQVESWQNHEVHYRQHIQVLKSARFKDWTPEAQKAFLEHVQQTDQLRQAARQQMMPQQPGQSPQMPPGPQGPPVPNGPPPVPGMNNPQEMM